MGPSVSVTLDVSHAPREEEPLLSQDRPEAEPPLHAGDERRHLHQEERLPHLHEYRDSRAAGSTHSRGEWNSVALTGPGARRFLNVHTGRAAKTKDNNESEAASTEFSKLLLHLWRAYRILTGSLIQQLQIDGLLDEAAAARSHRERTATVDDMQFLACEFYKVLTLI